MLRPVTDVFPFTGGYATFFKTSLIQVMHTAKYPEVEATYKHCRTDIYFKTKTVVAHAANR